MHALRLALFSLLALAAPLTPACEARSGPTRAALVELYTSEGCSSCPPADRWFSTLLADINKGGLVPLAFHVDYWDHLGWRDHYASDRHGRRQRAAVAAGGGRLVYTPQVLLDGRDFRDWRGGGAFAAAVADINRSPASARLRLSLRPTGDGAWSLGLRGQVDRPAPGLQAYAAVYGNGLRTSVTAGENAGRRLRHDLVVRELIGPLELSLEGRLSLDRELAGRSGPEGGGVAAFIQDPATGRVLQALMLPFCAGH